MKNLLRRDWLRAIAAGFGGCLAPNRSWGDATGSQSPQIANVRTIEEPFSQNKVNVTGYDGSTSIPLPDGKTLWLFGDTVEGPFDSIRGLPLADKLSNSGAIVPRQDVSQGIRSYRFLTSESNGAARQLIPFSGDEDPSKTRLWPIHGTCVGNEVYVFYHNISLIPGVDVFENFELQGMGIARASIGEWKFERLQQPDKSREFWKGNQPTYGVFTMRDNEYLLLWGSYWTGMFLARVPVNQISDLTQYEYLVQAPAIDRPHVDPLWSKECATSGSLFDAVPNEMSASYNRYLGKFVVFHSYLRENKIVMRTAKRVAGPWSAEQVVYRPPRLADDDLVYAAKEHPELARGGGRVVYLTYVHSAVYRPRLIEITFA